MAEGILMRSAIIRRAQALAAAPATRAVALLLVCGACGITDVSNPGPIQDEALESPAAGATVLVGLVSDIEVAAGSAAYYAGVASTDLTADATQGWVQNMGAGRLLEEESSYIWDEVMAARWTSEQGIARLERTQANPESNPLVAAAYLWAGYANRIAGDMACVAVFDGGPAMPNSEFYTRAAAHFEKASTMATAIGASMDSIRLAARAGLAQAHLILGNYDVAAGHAATVPSGFLWVAHRSANSAREQNRVWESTVLSTQATVHGTYSASLGPSGDPRTRWIDLNKTGSSGGHPYYQQMKDADRGDDIPLAKGAEMRLIEAEVLLRRGALGAAMDKINEVRTAAGVAAVAATTVAQAWVALDRERQLVLWLEGRRLKDNARLSAPGLSSWSAEFMVGRDNCFPPSLNEVASNPNLRRGL
jgi:starch-binding outer membrane protein, SusD/RagB family